MSYLPYDDWKNTEEGKQAIEKYLNEARVKEEYYRELKRKREERLMAKYNKESSDRARENGLLVSLGPNGHIDTDYFAELPLDIGYHASEDGNKLRFVSLGGVDIQDYLPPNIMEEILIRLEIDPN